MRYSIQKLQSDVMTRLGEIARPPSPLSEQSSISGVPWPEDIIGLKIASLLGEIGVRMIREAREESLGCGVLESLSCEVVKREMPCGLYGSEVRIPEGLLRIVSVKMGEWRRGVTSVIMPGSTEWNRQWSPEAGIAGSPERPMAYLDSDGEGRMLRLLGSEGEEDGLEWLSGWRAPTVSEEGEFDFPEGLYPHLVGEIASVVSGGMHRGG